MTIKKSRTGSIFLHSILRLSAFRQGSLGVRSSKLRSLHQIFRWPVARAGSPCGRQRRQLRRCRGAGGARRELRAPSGRWLWREQRLHGRRREGQPHGPRPAHRSASGKSRFTSKQTGPYSVPAGPAKVSAEPRAPCWGKQPHPPVTSADARSRAGIRTQACQRTERAEPGCTGAGIALLTEGRDGPAPLPTAPCKPDRTRRSAQR